MRRSIVRITSAVFIFTFLYCFNPSSASAVPAGIMALAWIDNTPGNFEIYVKTSVDNGTTWSAAKRLTNNAGDSFAPSVAVSGSNIHVAWFDNTPGNFEIFVKTSADNGATWSAAKRFTNNAGESDSPSIAASGSNVYVAWHDQASGGQIYMKTSADNGVTWSPTKKLTDNTGTSYNPSIAVSGSNIYVTWVHCCILGNNEIYFKTSYDNGATWSAAKRLTYNAGDSMLPSVAVSGSNVHISWFDDTSGNEDIYLKSSVDNGATWSAAKRLTNNTGLSQNPSIAANSSNIYVAFQDNTPGNNEIYLKTSSDNGATWSLPRRLTGDSGNSFLSSVVVNGSNVHVAWCDNTPGNFEIYVRTSADIGATWSAAKRLTNNAGASVAPSIAR